MDENQNNTTPPVDVHNVQPPVHPPQGEPAAPAPAPKKGGLGPVAGIVIIIVLLVFGGLYFWGAQLNKQDAANERDESALFDTSANDSIAPASDEPAQIEDDLDDFDTADFEAQLEADLEAIEAEL